MGRQTIGLRPYARDALELLGHYVRTARTNRRMTQAELASLAGCSTRTVMQVERGNPAVSTGVAFNICSLLGVDLFVPDPQVLAKLNRDARTITALLPSAVRPEEDLDVEF